MYLERESENGTVANAMLDEFDALSIRQNVRVAS
jgi:hypothetical protein